MKRGKRVTREMIWKFSKNKTLNKSHKKETGEGDTREPK